MFEFDTASSADGVEVADAVDAVMGLVEAERKFGCHWIIVKESRAQMNVPGRKRAVMNVKVVMEIESSFVLVAMRFWISL